LAYASSFAELFTILEDYNFSTIHANNFGCG
jgi:hypothetical protein